MAGDAGEIERTEVAAEGVVDVVVEAVVKNNTSGGYLALEGPASLTDDIDVARMGVAMHVPVHQSKLRQRIAHHLCEGIKYGVWGFGVWLLVIGVWDVGGWESKVGE